MTQPLSIAIPWSLSHYIPLNGFHPLYRALFDDTPSHITLNAWDNTELSNMLRADPALRATVLAQTAKAEQAWRETCATSLAPRFIEAFFPPNIGLTALLPGDIELHHTAPYPSLTRPFILHCESLAPLFFPFVQQGGGDFAEAEILRAHYARLFEDPLCRGIFSHIPHTLAEISRFFSSPVIDAKLHHSRIGLSRHALTKPAANPAALTAPKFLFINSANQNPANFIHRGGPVILRFWLDFIRTTPGAKLYLRCARPSPAQLAELGLDAAALQEQESRSIIWVQDYLSNAELTRLIAQAHFFLLPSASLHSVSIMQAMAHGAIPIVSDTVGTDRYVTDGETGLVLTGMRENNWRIDPATGLLLDHYHRNPALEVDLAAQLTTRVQSLIANPDAYAALRQRSLAAAATAFSGPAFAETFWAEIAALAAPLVPIAAPLPELHHALLEPADWPRLFESVPQPMNRIDTGRGRVTELAGAFIYTAGNGKIGLHDWSVLAEYFCTPAAPALTFVNNIAELGGKYLTATAIPARHAVIEFFKRQLLPYPPLHRLAARLFRFARRLRRRPRGEPAHVDIQLVAQNISGLNVIRCNGLYYAIPQDAGAFSEEKANGGGYRLCIKGSSLKRVLRKIAETAPTAPPPETDPPILAAEGVSGFNIIRYGQAYYAIPQGEGAFEHARALNHGYSRMHCAPTLDAAKAAIQDSVP